MIYTTRVIRCDARGCDRSVTGTSGGTWRGKSMAERGSEIRDRAAGWRTLGTYDACPQHAPQIAAIAENRAAEQAERDREAFDRWHAEQLVTSR